MTMQKLYLLVPLAPLRAPSSPDCSAACSAARGRTP
jgi:hypothetical protein